LGKNGTANVIKWVFLSVAVAVGLTGIAPVAGAQFVLRSKDEPTNTFNLEGGKSCQIVDSTIGGIRIVGEWSGPIRLSRVIINGQCTIIGVKASVLTIIDCNLRHGLTIEDVDVDQVQIVSSRFAHSGIKIIDSRIGELELISPSSDRWREFSERFVAERSGRVWETHKDVKGVSSSRCDAVSIEKCTIKERLAIGGDVFVPVISVIDSRLGDFYVSNRANASGAVECRGLTIRHRMGLDFQTLPARLVVEDCVVEEGKLRFSGWKNRFDASSISFDRSSFTFDECPTAKDVLPRLDDGSETRDERVRVLQKMKRFYLESGQAQDARIISERLATERWAQCGLTETPGILLDWMSSGDSVFMRLIEFWFGLVVSVTVFLVVAASLNAPIAVPKSEYTGQGRWYQMRCAIRVALDSACPVPLDDDLVLSMFAFVVHALCRMSVWILILIGAKAFSGY
jgi:hypothetical protein